MGCNFPRLRPFFRLESLLHPAYFLAALRGWRNYSPIVLLVSAYNSKGTSINVYSLKTHLKHGNFAEIGKTDFLLASFA